MITKSHAVLLIPILAIVVTVGVMDAKPKIETVVETHQLVINTQTPQKRGSYWAQFPVEDHTKFYRIDKALSLNPKDIRCLALNIFHEAAVEPFVGKIAVAQITHNRLETGRWGSTWCDVIYARAQFSWTLERRKREMNPTGKLWQESVKAAYEYVSNGLRVHGLEKSKYYHATWMPKFPTWSTKMEAVLEVGQHVFYVHNRS